MNGDMWDGWRAKVHHTSGLVGGRGQLAEWAEFRVVGGNKRDKVNAYLRVLDWVRWGWLEPMVSYKMRRD